MCGHRTVEAARAINISQAMATAASVIELVFVQLGKFLSPPPLARAGGPCGLQIAVSNHVLMKYLLLELEQNQALGDSEASSYSINI